MLESQAVRKQADISRILRLKLKTSTCGRGKSLQENWGCFCPCFARVFSAKQSFSEGGSMVFAASRHTGLIGYRFITSTTDPLLIPRAHSILSTCVMKVNMLW